MELFHLQVQGDDTAIEQHGEQDAADDNLLSRVISPASTIGQHSSQQHICRHADEHNQERSPEACPNPVVIEEQFITFQRGFGREQHQRVVHIFLLRGKGNGNGIDKGDNN